MCLVFGNIGWMLYEQSAGLSTNASTFPCWIARFHASRHPRHFKGTDITSVNGRTMFSYVGKYLPFGTSTGTKIIFSASAYLIVNMMTALFQGPDILKKAGGLHNFMNWNRSLLTVRIKDFAINIHDTPRSIAGLLLCSPTGQWRLSNGVFTRNGQNHRGRRSLQIATWWIRNDAYTGTFYWIAKHYR